MKCKSGKEEIVFLLTRVLEKYELESGEKINRNSNRKNYEDVAVLLSEISNELPKNYEHWQHQYYEPDYNPNQLAYPLRKYDITGNQIKDAYYNQIVSKPRPFLVDACYIYLYGVGRKGFEKNPTEPLLLETSEERTEVSTTSEPAVPKNPQVIRIPLEGNTQQELPQPTFEPKWKQQRKVLLTALTTCVAVLAGFIAYHFYQKKEWTRVKRDFNILPYTPTKEEIAAVEGIWLAYTGSPQARTSQPYRYHVVVPNIIDVKYEHGYFTFKRYGASFDHTGYMQYEAPGLVSIHSFLMSRTGAIESPRHSLMRMEPNSTKANVISASWNYDVGAYNQIIGIREVYSKVGKGGAIKEIMNTLENGSCNCKIIEWTKEDNKVHSFYLKNQRLESLPDSSLATLLNESSIIPATPRDGIILTSDTGITFPSNS
ncbi:hypothetical protein LX64_05098 [Chitinophaga skermanii]|uniref:Uncharacterized protein n=1 Tax=Chitinophaga skermanii TaxID=331697 RepID=A0A327PZD4_9BACT|nr:hypothetical protein [Chitinophaga skermanii]RAI97590.1 hypothetical protein LX64_05098 [Chitinophaga skermanii]